MLKDPESIALYDDVLIVFYVADNLDETGYYTYIDYGAKNSYGGMVRKTAMFKEYSYIGTFDDVDNFKNKFSNLSNDEIEKYMELLKCQLPYFAWQLGNEETQNNTIVNKDKVMRNLK